MKHFVELLKFKASEPFVARTAGRAVIGTLNALIIGLCAAHLRQLRFGVPVAQPTVDQSAEIDDAIEGEEVEEQVRVDQGVAQVREAPLKVAARLRLIRDSLAKDLDENAGEVELPLSGKRVKDPWHIGQAMEATLDWQLTSQRPVDMTRVKEEAKALGITEAEVLQALARRPQRQQQFLSQNKQEILSTAYALIPHDADGYVLSPEQDMATFDALPALTRLQLVASADRALYRAREREIQAHVDGNLMAMSNLGVIDGVRRELRAETQSWIKDERFKREVDEAMARNGRMPLFAPAPHPVQPTEAQKVLERRAA